MEGDALQGGDARPEGGLFAATRWSVVLRARDKSEAALATLCENYRRPLVVWLTSRGEAPHNAEDLVQGFFAQALRRDFLSRVGKENGRFRTFLLTCLRNYLNDERDRMGAEKRGGGALMKSLDDATDGGSVPVRVDAAPDLEYDRAWAQEILANAWRRLQQECWAQGRQALCSALEPVIYAEDGAAPYGTIGQQLGMSEGAVKVAAHRIRARLNRLIQDEVMQTVGSEEDLQQEIRYLVQLFSR